MSPRGRIVSPLSVRRAPRRKTFWIGSADSTAGQTLAAATAVLDQSTTWSDDLGPATVVRTRGELYVRSDVSTTEDAFGAMGMAVVKTTAAAIGITAIPTPITDEGDEGFFVWVPWTSSQIVGTTQGPVRANIFKFDSKAQRKIVGGDTLVVTLENASAAHGMVFINKFRILIKTN